MRRSSNGTCSPATSLERALQDCETTGDPLPAALLRDGLVGSKDLTAALALSLGVRFVDFQDTTLHQDAPTLVPADVARRHQRRSRSTSKATSSSSRSRSRPTTTRSAPSARQPATRSSPPSPTGSSSRVRSSRSTAPRRPRTTTSLDVLRDLHGEELHVNQLLDEVLALRGSDLHLTAGTHPVVRVHGEMRPLTDFPVLNGSQIRQMVYSIVTQKQREKFENELELDTSYTLPGKSRFRMNLFLQRDSVGCVMRVIPYEIADFDKLGIPPAVKAWANLPRGLVLVTGPTGSGKSTTLASLVDIINRERSVHIMTVEDPIEFLHQHKRAIVNQREVGEDTHSFANALKHVLRQDPDVILVGEMRDLETISTALTAAETGHLVFATLHTQDAPQSIDRIIDVFPAHQQQQVRVQLAASLQGICTQQLLPTPDGHGRVAACEVLVATPAIRNLIREAKTHQIYSMLQAGGKFGMVTMDMSLAKLASTHQISLDVAREYCANDEDLRRLMGA